jgi:hypothetical protein
MIGLLVTVLTFSVILATEFKSLPNSNPPSLTFGQEIFISKALIVSSVVRILAHSTYSSIVLAAILQISGTSNCFRNGILS